MDRTQPPSATIVVADDHPVIRQGIRALLTRSPEFAVIAEAGDGVEALALVEHYVPEVLVTDIAMPGLNGLELARRLSERCPRTRVVVFSQHQTEAYAAEAFRAGALAYVVKTALADDLAKAIREALAGRRFLSAPLSTVAIEAYAARAAGRRECCDSLTKREREVARLVALGMTYAEIGVELGISDRTVEFHHSNLMSKLGLSTREDLVRYAISHGLTLPAA